MPTLFPSQLPPRPLQTGVFGRVRARLGHGGEPATQPAPVLTPQDMARMAQRRSERWTPAPPPPRYTPSLSAPVAPPARLSAPPAPAFALDGGMYELSEAQATLLFNPGTLETFVIAAQAAVKAGWLEGAELRAQSWDARLAIPRFAIVAALPMLLCEGRWPLEMYPPNAPQCEQLVDAVLAVVGFEQEDLDAQLNVLRQRLVTKQAPAPSCDYEQAVERAVEAIAWVADKPHADAPQAINLLLQHTFESL